MSIVRDARKAEVNVSRPSVLLATNVDADVFASCLQSVGMRVTSVATGRGVLDAIKSVQYRVIVLDLDLPDVDGLEALQHIRTQEHPPATIVTTCNGSLNNAIQALRSGACDYLVKPFDPQRLLTAVRGASRNRNRRGEEYSAPDIDSAVTGASAAMREVLRIVATAASSKATVFITGESGTGKELTAKLIHSYSVRRDKPFIAINCSAIPRDLVESEVFGHVKGAFTGAVSDRAGAALQADGGTLFLDEICEMDADLQTKLLRFLQDGTVRRVGARGVEQVDVRIICATNRDPSGEVAAGRFREDLYYRLHVIPIRLPPLRERGEDALLIARKLLLDYSREEGKQFESLSPCAEAAISAYHWPGNVRQLQNVLRSAVVLNDGKVLTSAALPELVSRPTALDPGPAHPPAPVAGEGGEIDPVDLSRIRPLPELEREAILAAIRICNNNIARAAAALGVSPSTLYRKRQAWEGDL